MFCSYISEAAASLLDSRLNLHIVPKTQLVSFSSPVSLHELHLSLFLNMNAWKAFFYDWIDRTAYKNGKPLPEKVGSMQCFMHGYQGGHLLWDKLPVIIQSNHRRVRFPPNSPLARALDRGHIRRLDTPRKQPHEALPGRNKGHMRSHWC